MCIVVVKSLKWHSLKNGSCVSLEIFLHFLADKNKRSCKSSYNSKFKEGVQQIKGVKIYNLS